MNNYCERSWVYDNSCGSGMLLNIESYKQMNRPIVHFMLA